MVASFIKLLITWRTAIKSPYILENSLVRHVHIYDGILNDVNISATKTFRTFRQLTFFRASMPPDPTTLLCAQKQFYPSDCGLIAKYSWNLNLQEGGALSQLSERINMARLMFNSFVIISLSHNKLTSSKHTKLRWLWIRVTSWGLNILETTNLKELFIL